MARRAGREAVYAVAERFVEEALRSDGSLFTPGAAIWSAENIEDLYERFVGNPDESSDSFEDKFRRQLEGAPPETRQLAAELLYVYLVFPSNMGGDSKRRIIRGVLGGTSISVPKDLDQALDQGIASFGPALQNRPWQLWMLLEFFREWKTMPSTEEALSDPWRFKSIVFSVPHERAGVQCEALLHLVYPGTFEHTVSQRQKRLLAERFSHLNGEDTVDVDRRLLKIRGELTATYGENFDFHSDEMKSLWLRDVEDISEHEGASETDAKSDPLCPFSEKTFALLSALHDSPTRSFYLERKGEFKQLLEEPFQRLMHGVAGRMPPEVKAVMETEKGLFGRILKNDFKHGGAWDFYWAAFYPRGGKRITDAQLSAWINRDRLEFGFFVGHYGSEQRKRFVKNCEAHREELVELLGPMMDDGSFVYGEHGGGGGGGDGATATTFEGWLENAEEVGLDVSTVLSRDEVLLSPEERLVERAASTFERLFPLVLLATSEDPMPAILEYVGGPEGEVDVNPEYGITQCSEDTGVAEETLRRWVRAIERKGQAILYGPPGTGKTHLARHLARHLIGGTDGFSDLVQFHPAYAYEDFMQGIRPQSRDGVLTYPVVPGRFLEFCRKARKRGGPCVLIVDEINRANLSRVFGELMYLLEYREHGVPLAGGGAFEIPKNVRILGTMNTADRSIALVDHALRRRFAFLALYPDYDLLAKYHARTGFPVEGLIEELRGLNGHMEHNYQVGITFFLHENLAEELEDIWRMEIEPYLEEYFFGQPEKVERYRWDRVKGTVMP